MKCIVCGGVLKAADGLFVCENCGNKHQISEYFENTEVFMCYVENDENGRRTRDSVIAQELYHKLENKRIKVFNSRVSATSLTDADFWKAYEYAVINSKVIIVLGTTKENFEKIISENLKYFSGKTIIPIYAGIDAYMIPKELSGLQAINYDSIGSGNTLVQSLLYILGRADEVDIIEISNKNLKKKQRIIITTIVSLFALIIAVSTYITFGTHYVLNSKKYEYAEKLTEKGSYIEAITILTKLKDYGNSQNLLKSIYDNYAGYYNTDDERYSFYFRVTDNSNAQIETVYYSEDKKQIKFTAENHVSEDKVDFNFLDTQNNQGKCEVHILNDGISFSIVTEEINSEFFIENADYQFKIDEKKDAPLTPTISNEVIMGWLKNGITRNDLLLMGYELNPGEVNDYRGSDGNRKYFIGNTEVQIEVADDSVTALLGPAEIMMPDKIGSTVDFLYENGIAYLPKGELYLGIMRSEQSGNTGVKIAKDTMIAVTSNKLDDNMNQMLVFNVFYKQLEDACLQLYPDCPVWSTAGRFQFLLDNGSHLLVFCPYENEHIFYKVRKRDGAISHIAKIGNADIHLADEGYIFLNIADYPEYFSEFMN